MDRSHLFLAAFFAIAITLTTTGFRNAPPVASRVGSLVPATPMSEPRSGHTATLLPDGKVLIAGGMRRNQDFYKSAELYNPATGKFRLTGEMNQRRVGHIAVLLRSGKVLITGGWIGQGPTETAELYDPGTGTFTAIAARMTSRRGDPTATLLDNGDVLIAGGAEGGGARGIASAEVFHADKMTFEAVGSMHAGRVSHTATLLTDGCVLIAGGRGESVSAGAELYDPKTGKFAETGKLFMARYKHTAGLLPDGRVLIAGGSDERDWHGTMSSAEIYDPRTRKFMPTSPMHDSRFKMPHEAVQLSSGLLLIAGGSEQVETFDSNTGKFVTAPGTMLDARHFMTETKLRDGSVLLAGGYANNPEATALTWIYRR